MQDINVVLIDADEIDDFLKEYAREYSAINPECKKRDDFFRMFRNVEQSQGIFTKVYIVKGIDLIEGNLHVCESKEEADELCASCNEYQRKAKRNWFSGDLDPLHPLGVYSENGYYVVEANFQFAKEGRNAKQ
jgi:hypothetical protein